jgi:uncharacterized membrane protein
VREYTNKVFISWHYGLGLVTLVSVLFLSDLNIVYTLSATLTVEVSDRLLLASVPMSVLATNQSLCLNLQKSSILVYAFLPFTSLHLL